MVEVAYDGAWYAGRVILTDVALHLIFITFTPTFSTSWDDWYDYRNERLVRRPHCAASTASAAASPVAAEAALGTPIAPLARATSAAVTTAAAVRTGAPDPLPSAAAPVEKEQLDQAELAAQVTTLKGLARASAQRASTTAAAVRTLALFATRKGGGVCELRDAARTAAGRSAPVEWCARALQQLWALAARDATRQRPPPEGWPKSWLHYSNVRVWVEWCSTAVCSTAVTGLRHRAAGRRARCFLMCLKEVRAPQTTALVRALPLSLSPPSPPPPPRAALQLDRGQRAHTRQRSRAANPYRGRGSSRGGGSRDGGAANNNAPNRRPRARAQNVQPRAVRGEHSP